MPLEKATGLPAYQIPSGIKKQSWAKKRRKKKGRKKKVKGIPEDISEIYK